MTATMPSEAAKQSAPAAGRNAHGDKSHSGADSVIADPFKLAFRNHPAGVAVITADAGDGPVAFTATSVFSVSIEPPLLGFSVSEQSSSMPTIRKAKTVVVHLLGADQLEIAILGATSGIDRFADTSIWARLPSGEPYFPSTPAWIHGRIIDNVEAAGSVVVLVQALQTRISNSEQRQAGAFGCAPLVFHNRAWHRLDENSRIPSQADQ